MSDEDSKSKQDEAAADAKKDLDKDSIDRPELNPEGPKPADDAATQSE